MGSIVRGMRQYFADTPGGMNYIVPYFYLIIGILMSCMTVSIFLMPHNVRH